ncbi:MAG: patatin-like phospholipase family protein [Candidatus Nanopelagicales bacterium]
MGERVAVVLSGAAARGAFQAGAMSRLVPALTAQGYEPTVFIGTSAGGINAALWASLADLGPEQCGAAVLDVWREMGRADVFAHPVKSLIGDVPRVLGSVAGWSGGLPALLDTTPLRRTAERVLDVDRLAKNVEDGTVVAVGVSATRIPTEYPAKGHVHTLQDRTTVFADSGTLSTEGISDPDRAVDVADGPIRREHVLASAAIPIAFPPVWIDQPVGASGWYMDGGVRLNTPLRPALALGADRILVVAAMSTEYGNPPVQPTEKGSSPPMADSAAVVMHSVLADRMAEDLRTLRSRNRSAVEAGRTKTTLTKSNGDELRAVPLMAVSPEPGQLRDLAAATLRSNVRRGPLGFWRESDSIVLDRMLRGLGDGPGRAELFSYLYFDETYFAEQIKLGEAAAEEALASGWALD